MELYCLDWQKAEPTHTGMETSNLALCVGKAKLLYACRGVGVLPDVVRLIIIYYL